MIVNVIQLTGLITTAVEAFKAILACPEALDGDDSEETDDEGRVKQVALQLSAAGISIYNKSVVKRTLPLPFM